MAIFTQVQPLLISDTFAEVVASSYPNHSLLYAIDVDKFFKVSGSSLVALGGQGFISTLCSNPTYLPASTMYKTDNLSGISNYTTARSNLGLGTLATQNGTFSGTSSGTNTGDQTLSSLGAAASGANTDITSVLLNQTGLVVKGLSSNALTIKPNETLTAPRILNIVTGDAARTLTFSGDATISGTNTGDQTTVSGNAGTATILQTARNINGVSFNGSADITVTAAASTLTGTTLASGVTASSLTSFGASIALGTPASGNLANCTFPTLNQNTTGTANIAGGTAGAIPYQSGANTTTVLAATATANKMLLSGASAAPVWSTSTIPNTSGTAGQYFQSDGTNIVWSSGVGQASITSNSSGINSAETVIVKTGALAANRLQAGTTIRVTLIGTCTSTVANASTFSIRIGTAGTTSDGLMQQAVTPIAATSGTSIPFRMVFEITIRTTGSSATSHGYCTLDNTGITGICATQTPQVILPTFTNFNTTTANNIISCTYKSAASTTTSTFNDAFIEIVYL